VFSQKYSCTFARNDRKNGIAAAIATMPKFSGGGGATLKSPTKLWGTFACDLGHEHPGGVGADVVAQVAQIVLLRIALTGKIAVEQRNVTVYKFAGAAGFCKGSVHRTAARLGVNADDVAAAACNVAGKGETFKRYYRFCVTLLHIFRSFP